MGTGGDQNFVWLDSWLAWPEYWLDLTCFSLTTMFVLYTVSWLSIQWYKIFPQSSWPTDRLFIETTALDSLLNTGPFSVKVSNTVTYAQHCFCAAGIRVALHHWEAWIPRFLQDSSEWIPTLLCVVRISLAREKKKWKVHWRTLEKSLYTLQTFQHMLKK